MIDDFNRANAGSLGAAYTADFMAAGYASHDIVSNQCKADAGAFSADYRNDENFGPDVEVFATLIAMPSSGAFRLYARLGSVGTASCFGYELEIDATGSYLVRMDDPLNRVTIANLGVAFAAGNKAKLECQGSTIRAYRDTGSGFTQIGSVADATYGAAGRIGILTQNDTGVIIDDLNANTLSAGGGGGTNRRGMLMGVG